MADTLEALAGKMLMEVLNEIYAGSAVMGHDTESGYEFLLTVYPPGVGLSLNPGKHGHRLVVAIGGEDGPADG